MIRRGRPSTAELSRLRAFLDAAYDKFNKPEYVHPDPLELVLRYRSASDREVAGIIASALALGTVKGILSGAGDALSRLGPAPARTIDETGPAGLRRIFRDFRYRFFSGDDLSAFLAGVAAVRRVHGSLGRRVSALAKSTRGETVLPALSSLAEEIARASPRSYKSSLFPSPKDGSACKRPLLWLRWMARKDDVDPGPWRRGLEPLLVVPLDTHMERVGRTLGLLTRKGSGLASALELASSFRLVNPDDPARYDFALTRPGINPCLDAGPDMACLRKLKER